MPGQRPYTGVMGDGERVPALVGKREAGEILGIDPNNMRKLEGLPAPLPGTGPTAVRPAADGTSVAATPLWPRSVIEAFAKLRASRG